MAERMLKFTTIERRTPEKREAGGRSHDFLEIYADFIDAKASEMEMRTVMAEVGFNPHAAGGDGGGKK